MKPYFETKLGKLFCGDCLEVMKDIPDESIDCIITSPPYNVGMNYGTNDRRNYKEYLSFMKEVLIECYRVLINGGRISINLPSSILQSSKSRMAYLTLDYVLIMREIGFIDREWISWVKAPNFQPPGRSTAWGSWRSPSCPYLRDASEFIIIMDKKNHKRIDKKGQNDISIEEFMKFTTNCWYFAPERNRIHPAPFPEELPYRLTKLYTWQDDLILDPFLGSGTTAAACEKLGRKWIGIELSESYCEVAKKRLAQQRLFS